jgi:uncharacterized peroxidase-related enzyme
MSFVSLISEEQASPQLKRIYEQVRQEFGFLPNYIQALGRAPQLIEAHLGFGELVTSDGALSKTIKEQIGLVVSGINTSSYCIAIHMEMLRRLGVEKPLSRKLATHYASAPVEEKVQVLFRFADRLTRKPGEIAQADVEAVSRAGWGDAEIVETVLTVAYFNLINRVSAGLGLIADF